MKKLILLITAIILTSSAIADEGMWLLPYIQKNNIKQMQELGYELTADEIYNVDGSSLSDAIVIFGRGCTGEIVSPNGLLFTNHHCGYGNIQSLSSVEHDYLKNGFWAMNNQEEIPAPGLEVRFIRKIEDVSGSVLGSVPSISVGKERDSLVGVNIKNIVSQREKGCNEEVIVKSFFGGNQYFLFVIEVFKDIRFVGAPPSSIGKFGGETDNWMWPRHTGDFSLFRVYANKDNGPAEYSKDNVPYKSDNYLKISIDGYEESDFGMILGFPGSTERYMTSYEIDRMLEVENPQRIFIRGERQNILKADMLASDKVRIQYASKYAGSSNYWKNSIGMSRGIKRLNVKGQKQAQEIAFQKWADENSMPQEGYIDALGMIKESVESSLDEFGDGQYLGEALSSAVEIMMPAFIAERAYKGGDTFTEFEKSLNNFYKDYNTSTDKKVAKRMFEIVKEGVKDKPTIFEDVIDGDFGGDTDKYVDYLYENSKFANQETLLELLVAEKSSLKLADSASMDSLFYEKFFANDPATILYKSVSSKRKELFEAQQKSEVLFKDGHRIYIDGLMKMDPEKSWYPDANFTMRLTYGQVLPYDPVDGVTYKYETTLKGVIEKEDTSNPTEFTVPAKLKELYEARDFGKYVNGDGEVPVGFLVNCDITGGNSGSPVLNGKGELIGLAFDGNWEAMSGDVAFEPAVQRTISVDVRYLLFVLDKFAGAGWLLDEMTIVGGEK